MSAYAYRWLGDGPLERSLDGMTWEPISPAPTQGQEGVGPEGDAIIADVDGEVTVAFDPEDTRVVKASREFVENVVANWNELRDVRADKAASDDVIEALAARIAELEAALDRAERERDVLQMANRKARTNIGDMHDRLAAERVRGERLAKRLKKIRKLPPLYVRPSGGKDYHKCFFLAADPEGGSDMTETPQQQIDRLAAFIMEEVPGEPSQSEGAVDTAIRLIRAADPEGGSP